MYNKYDGVIKEGDIISLNNRRTYSYKGYDIQVVDIRPGDTILFHLNDDLDVCDVSSIMEEMSKTFPENTIIPVNEWILKGMTILRQAKPVGDSVDEVVMIQPLEEMYPDLFGNHGTAVKPGEIIW